MENIIHHYDEEYYLSHYGSFMYDEKYVNCVANFYKHAIFNGLDLDSNRRTLDFGSGPGQLTHGIDADCYDPSVFIQDYLRGKNRRVYSNRAEIPKNTYRAVFNSHSLEHCLHPADELKEIHALLEEKGILILILPKEAVPGKPTTVVDDNRHFYAWNFQLITNLLCASGYRVLNQRVFHAPYGLRTMVKYLPMPTSVHWSYQLGRLFQNYPALLTVAEKI